MVLRWTCGIYTSRGTGSLLIRGRCTYTSGGMGRGIYIRMHSITGIYTQAGNGPPRGELTYHIPQCFLPSIDFYVASTNFPGSPPTMAFVNIEDYTLAAGADMI